MNSLERPKKSGVEFYTSVFCKVRALIVGQNESGWRKNLSDTGETGLLRTGEIRAEIDALVTTNHLLLQHPPGTTGALLPISQPNPDSPGGNNCAKRAKRGPGGSAGAQPPKAPYR
jgi:hypothetical protein